FILNLRMMKENSKDIKNAYVMKQFEAADQLIEQLPYKLTNAQLKTYEEIKSDLSSDRVMNRLIQGDVGSGKTIVGFLACLTACQNGHQSAFMAPTEVLAAQHYETFAEMIRQYELPVHVALLTGSTPAKEKKLIYEMLDSGEVNLVVGTHALIQDKVSFRDLALVITDEQHRFGVKQRERLTTKSDHIAHTIVMSATPIPRTLGIIMYGDLDISVMNELPASRLPIKNCVVGTDYRKKAYDFMQKEIEQGHQVYVICPMVEENEEIEAEDVINYTKKLKAYFPDSVKIDYLHGKMKPSQKLTVMNDFLENRLHILVSTTVVEVGVNVPNATVMLIENAERFGLAQLHQLRGRIGRGAHQSYCIFLSGSDRKEKLERLNILSRSNDGFYIAEEDLKTRGPGDFFGIRQSGLMQFQLADIFTDVSVLQQACDAVSELLMDDPQLSKKQNQNLLEKLKAFQSSQCNIIPL
ncbi:MAG: ATP-dependent DNA helicase RecG, partial [Clostridia bacterium]|nr:ATP-dependent DNA helicase RecG [Clostridia bacterium]